MNGFCKSLNLWSFRHPARLAGFAVILAAAWVFVAQAQAPTPPFAEFQYANLTGSGNTITASHVPVVLASGVTVYQNLTMQFNVDSNGNLGVSPGFPQVILAPTILSSSFIAGNYAAPSNFLGGKGLITITGPGLTDGGVTEWTLSETTGADPSTYPATATWYVGPIASNPYATRLKAAGITSTAWSYGVLGIEGGGDNYWYRNALIGVSQIGNTLTISSFTAYGSTDYSLPGESITFTLKP